MIRKPQRKVIPLYAVLPLLLTAVSMLCSYQAAKIYQLIFGFRDLMDLTLSVDLNIPFAPGWGWIYVGAFFFWAYQFITVAQDCPESAYKLSIADLSGKFLCLLFFLFLPTTNVRPEVNGTGLTALLMKIIYALDSPTNLFPSIHCFVPWLGTRCMFGIKNHKHKGIHCTLSFIGTMLIFASTLFTKQHVFIDVLGGIAVAEIGLLVAKYSPLPRMLCSWNESFVKTRLCKFLSF